MRTQPVALVFAFVWLAVTACQMTSAEWISAHHLQRTAGEWTRAVLKWGTAPIVFVILFVLPAVESHWKLFKKVHQPDSSPDAKSPLSPTSSSQEELTYAVAPKSAGSTPSNSYGDLEALDARSKKSAGSVGLMALL